MLIASGPSQPFTILKAALKNKTKHQTKQKVYISRQEGSFVILVVFVGFFECIRRSYTTIVSCIPQDTTEPALKVSIIIGKSNAREKRYYLQRKWKEYL